MSWGLVLFRAAMGAALGLAGVAVAAPAGASNDPRFNEQWGLSLIGAPAAWEVGTGAGMTIAVVDTGVDFGHPDLQGKILPGRNFVTPGASAQDDNGHGTHVAGIAAAATGNGVGVAGTAPGARILPVKVLDADGRGSVEAISEGIVWAANNGAQVINLSLGPNAVVATLFGSGLEGAVNEAWSKGAVVVIAAGNNLLFGSSYSTVNALVVTATTRDDGLASSYASPVGSAKWGIAAPGGAGGLNKADDILSTYWSEGASTYDHLAGTSMATPHVAGAAAVLRGQRQLLTPQQTVDRLLGTAKDLGAAGRDSTYGAGRLNLACAAGRCGGSATGSAGAGSTTADPGTQPASNTSGSKGSPGSGASSGDTGNAAQVSEGGGTGSTATGPAGTNTRTTGSRAPGSNGPAGTAPVSPSPAPSTAVSGDPAGVSDPGAPASDPGAEADLGATATGDPGPSVSLAAGRAVAGEKRPSAVLTGAAGGLLLLVAFSGLGLRRRRPPRARADSYPVGVS